MKNKISGNLIQSMFNEIEKLIPDYMKNEVDKNIAHGNVSACVIDEDGNVYGKIFGGNKARGRHTFKVAWTKASQVWLTGIKTGEYEKLVFTNVIGENANGIENPDLIGWEGGQPLSLTDGTILSVGFSGFRGFLDNEIMSKALEEAQKYIK